VTQRAISPGNIVSLISISATMILISPVTYTVIFRCGNFIKKFRNYTTFTSSC